MRMIDLNKVEAKPNPDNTINEIRAIRRDILALINRLSTDEHRLEELEQLLEKEVKNE